MRHRADSTRLALALAVATLVVAVLPVRADEALDAAMAEFWHARSDAELAAAVDAVVATEPAFGEVLDALRAGRSYAADVPTGRQLLTRPNRDGVEHPYVVHVPDSYDPATPYQVRVYLHGGVMRPKRGGRKFLAERRDPGARRLVRRHPRIVASVDLVADEPDREPRRHPERPQARLQRGRESGLSPRDLRRRNRCLLPRVQGAHALGRVAAVQRPSGGAGQPDIGRGRADVRCT